MRRTSSIVAFSLLLALPLAAEADEPISFVEVGAKAVRVDGSLREWPSSTFQSLGRGHDGVMEYALGYDANGIYLAADVVDRDLVRSSRPGASDDGVRLSFETPDGGGRVHLFVLPAVAGRAASGVYLGTESQPRTAVRGATVVEAITSEGYALEAFIPFKGVKELADFARLRGSIALVDGDPGRETRRIATSGERLPAILGTGGELGAFTEFASRVARERAFVPRFDRRVDVLGGKKAERVALIEDALFLGGGDHADGASFESLRLGVEVLEVREVAFADLTGDGKAELILRVQSRATEGTIEEAFVITFDEGGPRSLLRLPYALESGGRRVANVVRLEAQKRGPKLVVVRAGIAEGFDGAAIAQDEDDFSLLLPFGPYAARHYELAGGRVRLVKTEPNPRYQPPEERAASAPRHDAAAAPAAPGVDAVIEAARKQLGLPARAPRRFELEANLAGDPTPERLVVIDRTVIVAGPKFRGGNAYFQMQLGVDAADRIRRVETLDVDGDGRDEVVVRINQDLGQGVTRCILLFYRVTESGASQIHAREIARYYQGASLINTYEVVGTGKKRQVVFLPGEAKGFSATNWPFGEIVGDTVEPLLLPWRDRDVRKRF